MRYLGLPVAALRLEAAAGAEVAHRSKCLSFVGYPSALVIEPPGPWSPLQTSTLRSACAGLPSKPPSPSPKSRRCRSCPAAPGVVIVVVPTLPPACWASKLPLPLNAGTGATAHRSCRRKLLPHFCSSSPSSRLEGALCHAARHGAWTKRKLQRSLNKNLSQNGHGTPQYLRNPV